METTNDTGPGGVDGHVDEIDLSDLALFAAGPPHDAFRRLRDRAPVHWNASRAHTPGGEGFWNLTRYDDVLWAARRPEIFSSVTGGDRSGGGTLIEDLPAGFAAGVLRYPLWKFVLACFLGKSLKFLMAAEAHLVIHWTCMIFPRACDAFRSVSVGLTG